jgi:hypothetical protein
MENQKVAEAIIPNKGKNKNILNDLKKKKDSKNVQFNDNQIIDEKLKKDNKIESNLSGHQEENSTSNLEKKESTTQEINQIQKHIETEEIINSYLKLNVYISNLDLKEKRKKTIRPEEEEIEENKAEESDDEATLEKQLEEIEKVPILKNDIYFLNGEKVKPATRNLNKECSNKSYGLQKLKITCKVPEKYYINKKIEEDYYKEDLDYIYNKKKIYQ